MLRISKLFSKTIKQSSSKEVTNFYVTLVNMQNSKATFSYQEEKKNDNTQGGQGDKYYYKSHDNKTLTDFLSNSYTK